MLQGCCLCYRLQVLQVDERQCLWPGWLDPLHDALALGTDAGTQDGVAPDDGGKALLQSCDIYRTVHAQGKGDMVHDAVGPQLLVHPEFALRK
jgi:hypothetical protein